MALTFEAIDRVGVSAEIVDIDAVAARRERFQRYAEASRRVATYVFQMPDEAMVAAFNDPTQARRAVDQLHVILALTGGSLAKFPGGLAAHVPLFAAGRFEDLARSLIEAFMVAFRRDDG
ncbi:hypothetical protein [Caulobacter sp. LjRoot300]|uniref:hypothetical protein n=1 Tax=Caulobacter sp. LjRoot300 TaxID=3342321 RepID=UPI003ED0A934